MGEDLVEIKDLDLKERCLLAFSTHDYNKVSEIVLPLAESGVAWAKTALGTLYYLGLGVDQNLGKAEECFLEAYAEKDELALINLISLYQYMGRLEDVNRLTTEASNRELEFYSKPNDPSK